MSNEINYPMKPIWQWGLMAAFWLGLAIGIWTVLDRNNFLVGDNPVTRFLGLALVPTGLWCLYLWGKAWPDRHSAVRITDEYVESVGGGGRPIRVRRSEIQSVSPRIGGSGVMVDNDQGVDLEIHWRSITLPVRLRSNDEAADYFAELLGVPRRDPTPAPKRRWWKRSKGRRLRRDTTGGR